MRLTWDTETHLISPGRVAPRMVSAALKANGGETVLRGRETLADFDAYLPENLHVLHSAAFDFGVLLQERPDLASEIFRAYEEDRVSDTMIREKIIMLGRGHLTMHPTRFGPKPTKYSLAALAERRLGLDMSEEKTAEDAWRTRYAELDGIPIAQWPEEARAYAINDVDVTDAVWLDQRSPADVRGGSLRDGQDRIVNEGDQVRAAWALHLMSAWGLRTDPVAVKSLREALEVEVDALNARLLDEGLVRWKKVKGEQTLSRNMKAIRALVEEAYHGNPPLTDTGKAKTDSDTLAESGHPTLIALAESSGSAKLLSAFVPVLEAGTAAPIHPSYDVLKETGRTSSFKPNIQQLPRKGGVRECFVPREGWCFFDVDYDTLELRAWAQVCLDQFGYSRMADALRRGLDPHLEFAARLMGKSYEDVKDWKSWPAGPQKSFVKDQRQLAKVANFGFPGGLRWRTFVKYAAGQGVIVSEDKAQSLETAWREMWPEHDPYFEMVADAVADTDETPVVIGRTGLIRGSASFTAACNTPFQGLAAAGAKKALFLIAKACYADKSSPAYGARPSAFIHDEVFGEVRLDRAHEGAYEVARLMREGMAQVIPDIPILCEPCIMPRWYKDGETKIDKNGRLALWTPENP